LACVTALFGLWLQGLRVRDPSLTLLQRRRITPAAARMAISFGALY
jgi:hypothetical protein